MKQVWVVKGTLAHTEVLITKDIRKMNNQKSKKKKRRVQKLEDDGYPFSGQRSHQVSVSKPNFIWVPKVTC